MSWSAEAYQQRLRDIDRLTRENEALRAALEKIARGKFYEATNIAASALRYLEKP